MVHIVPQSNKKVIKVDKGTKRVWVLWISRIKIWKRKTTFVLRWSNSKKKRLKCIDLKTYQNYGVHWASDSVPKYPIIAHELLLYSTQTHLLKLFLLTRSFLFLEGNSPFQPALIIERGTLWHPHLVLYIMCSPPSPWKTWSMLISGNRSSYKVFRMTIDAHWYWECCTDEWGCSLMAETNYDHVGKHSA